ncbi:MAG TPA: S-adenosylmethionine decarboxylase [Burkholderiaceae bacterium]|nr:S-adenosylmethionine decarboxylase [Burkholderiaceae bacterium]
MRGVHFTADLFDCRDPDDLLGDGRSLAALCEELAARSGLNVVARQFHAFGPSAHGDGGHTGVLLLAESHLAVHTWPELRAATLDVFVCNVASDNTAKAQTLLDALVARFGAARAIRQQLVRGLTP